MHKRSAQLRQVQLSLKAMPPHYRDAIQQRLKWHAALRVERMRHDLPATNSAWRFVEVVVVKAAKKQYVSRPVRVT